MNGGKWTLLLVVANAASFGMNLVMGPFWLAALNGAVTAWLALQILPRLETKTKE